MKGSFGARCVPGLAALLFACGGAQEEPKAPAEATVNESQGEPTGLPPVKLTPVAAPPELISVARLSSLPTAADTIVSWLGLPVEWRDQLDAAAPGVTQALASGAAVEFAAILDPNSLARPKIHFALSVPIESREAGLNLAKARGWPVERISAAAHFVDVGRPCAVAASLGPSKARWVCSESRESVEALLPYMTRGLPSETLPKKTLYATVRAEPFRKRFGKRAGAIKMMGVPFLLREAAIDNATFDNAMADAAHAIADDVVGLTESDLKAITLGLDVNESSGEAVVELHLELQDNKTWLAKSLADAASRAMPATDQFWTAPPGLQASYSAKSNPELVRGIYKNVGQLVRGYLEHLGATSNVAQDFAAATEALYVLEGPGTGVTKGPEDPNSWAGALGFEYSVSVMDGDAEGAIANWMTALAALVNDAKFRQGLKRVHEVDLVSLARVKQRKLTLDGLSATEWTLDLAEKDVAALGKLLDSKDKLGPVSLSALVAQDGSRSWTAMGVGKQDLAQAVTAFRTSPPTDRSELGVLRQTKNSLAGFVTTKALLMQALGSSLAQQAEEIGADSVLRAMPSGGTAPIVYRLTASNSGPTGSLYLHLPKAAIQDLAAATMSVLAAMK